MEQAISPFLTMFSTLYGTYFPIYMYFKMSSAAYFNLDQFKILSSGNGLKTKIIILSTFILSSANGLNLDQSKILSFGKEVEESDI